VRHLTAWVAFALLLAAPGCSRRNGLSPDDASASADGATATGGSDASTGKKEPPREKTPKELLEEHREAMTALVEKGNYREACQGSPWFNQVLCNWVATRADDKPVGRPDGEVFRWFFTKEHWKHVYGRILEKPDGTTLEVSVGGYKNHCILELTDTKYSSKGSFNLWVQEQPETREITLNSGSTANWVVLEEASLAKTLMNLARSGGGIEGRAMAKDAMKMIAKYVTYAELKGVIPPVPGAAPAAPAMSVGAAAAGTPAVTAIVPAPVTPPTSAPVKTVVAPTPAAPPVPTKDPRARAACLSACVSKCADDAACERTCAGKCPS